MAATNRAAVRREKGQLKIFFSYCRAVERNTVLIDHARAAATQGADIVIGDLTLPSDDIPFEQLPYIRRFEYGRNIEIFDLDQALRRQPDLILLQDPTYLNPENCRHQRRYQEIEELLRSRISVYTTMDITDLDSLSDVTASILGGRPIRGIPDHFFSRADEVILIDAAPATLSRRTLASIGLTGSPDSVCRRLERLREQALTQVADRLNSRLEKTAADIEHKTGEHILVCISPSPSNAKVIRSAARMAAAFHGSFTALYVDPAGGRGDAAAKAQLNHNLHLAEQLGAAVSTIYGNDPALQIAEYARASAVTKIVIGRTNHRMPLPFRRKSLVDRLIHALPTLDVYIIPDDRPRYRKKLFSGGQAARLSPFDLGKALLIISVASLIGLFFDHLQLHESDIITVYLLGMLLTSIWTQSRATAVIAAFLNVITFNFLFTEPRFTLLAYDAGYLITFLVILVSGLITSTLAGRIKAQARMAAHHAYRTETLLETNRLLQKAETKQEILSHTAHQLVKLLERPIIFYPLSDPDQIGQPLVFPLDKTENDLQAFLSPHEQEVAQWVCVNNKQAGTDTDTFPSAKTLCLAVRGQSEALAVAAIPMAGYPALEPYVRNLMITILDECSLTLIKEDLRHEKQQAELSARQEALRANLLRAISHDLRTPLTGIRGSANILLESGDRLEESQKRSLYRTIHEDAMWLINLVENLLSVTRLENGAMEIHPAPELIEEVFSEALTHLDQNAKKHHITVQLEDDLLMGYMDAKLICQVIINIVNNAIQYTPDGSEITLSARQANDQVIISIADNGPGIPEAHKTKLFDMFYTVGKTKGDGRRGLGLGLALCRSIVRAHGGEIRVDDNLPHGTVFSFTITPAEVISDE